MKQPQPNARESEWQSLCRAMYPGDYVLHHCRERKARYRKGMINIPIGHLFINILPDHLHTGPDGIHSTPFRRNRERLEFSLMCYKFRKKYQALFITDEEYHAIMDYR